MNESEIKSAAQRIREMFRIEFPELFYEEWDYIANQCAIKHVEGLIHEVLSIKPMEDSARLLLYVNVRLDKYTAILTELKQFKP